jgi:sugar fermentation stimulation protein A
MLMPRKGASPEKLPYTAVAVEREGVPVLLHTQMANRVVRFLFNSQKVPGFEKAKIIREEVTMGSSRFDFKLQQGSQDILCEVKSCSLFGETLAMFPDAVTVRGRRHLEELGELAEQGFHCLVIYLVQWPKARYFLPDFHTDPAFSQVFRDVREQVSCCPLAVGWSPSLQLSDTVRKLSVPWSLLEAEDQNQGSYMLILHLPQESSVKTGGLGDILFRKGYYIYVGSAKKNLLQRVNRHLNRRKSFFWHIDYLRNQAASCLALPIRASADLEHDMAARLARIAPWQIPGFGSSDCSCGSHLFGMEDNPLHNEDFIQFLLYFRIVRLEAMIDGITP